MLLTAGGVTITVTVYHKGHQEHEREAINVHRTWQKTSLAAAYLVSFVPFVVGNMNGLNAYQLRTLFWGAGNTCYNINLRHDSSRLGYNPVTIMFP